MGGEVRRVEFAAADATRLEGVLHLPAGPIPCPAAVVCHPHPQMGGDMSSPVVVAVCRELADRGWAALRFNFRGKGRSEGSFDDGRGEIEDVAGALDHLCAQPEANPDRLAVAGYSFGAWVGLRHAVRDPRVSWLVGISLVQNHYDEPFLDAETRPKLFVVGDRDPWAPQDGLRAYVERLQPPKTLHILPGTDHFFGGQESKVARMVGAWLEKEIC